MSGFTDCCRARAASGHAAAVLPSGVMNSRRLIALLAPRTESGRRQSITFFGLRIVWLLHSRELYPQKRLELNRAMFALCQKRQQITKGQPRPVATISN